MSKLKRIISIVCCFCILIGTFSAANIAFAADTYTVTFYNSKEDTEPIDTRSVIQGRKISTNKFKAPEGYYFSGWADKSSDHVVTTERIITYNYSEDKSFYALWTKYENSIAIMVRDYNSGEGWTIGATLYGEKGKTLTQATVTNAAKKAAQSVGAEPKLSGKEFSFYADETCSGRTLPYSTREVSYMIKDEIVEAAVGYLPSAYKKTANLADLSAYHLDKVKKYVEESEQYSIATVNGEETIVEKSVFILDGEKSVYLYTSATFNITWKVPQLNAETNEFDSYAEATSTTSMSSSYETYAKIPDSLDVTPPKGYTFNGWKNEATGEYVDYYKNVGSPIKSTMERNLTFVADFSETQYGIVFDINNEWTKLISGKTYKVGDSFDPSTEVFTNIENKTETKLPIVGFENAELEKPFTNMYGYKFLGWSFSKNSTVPDVEFPLEITEELVKNNFYSGNIHIYGVWEPLEYEVKFYYVTPETDMSKPVEDRKYAEPIVIKHKTKEAIKRDLPEEQMKIVEASTPAGYRFLKWSAAGESSIPTNMPPNDLILYAVYIKKSINVYVDYNNKFDENGNKAPLKKTMSQTMLTNQEPIYYGDELVFETYNDEEGNPVVCLDFSIRHQLIVGTNKPGENYEVVDWVIYHVKEGEDPYDQANWIPGINDEGTSTVYSTIIYQPVWKAHSEFIFRLYNTADRLYMALGKNLKSYYWSGNSPSERKDAVLNTNPEFDVILLFIPKFENFDSSRLLDLDMWSNVTIRIDPFNVPKSSLTLESFIALMKTIGGLIGKL